MKASRFRFMLLGASMLLSLWLFADVSRKNLYSADPVTGRVFGCYSDLEMLLGLKSPSGWIPPAEAAAGMLLFFGPLVVGGVSAIHRFRAGRERGRSRPPENNARDVT